MNKYKNSFDINFKDDFDRNLFFIQKVGKTFAIYLSADWISTMSICLVGMHYGGMANQITLSLQMNVLMS